MNKLHKVGVVRKEGTKIIQNLDYFILAWSIADLEIKIAKQLTLNNSNSNPVKYELNSIEFLATEGEDLIL